MTLEVAATDRSYEERFRAFVERGRTLMQEPAVPRADDPSTIERFVKFVRDAERLATAEAHAYLRWFAPFVRPARALLVDHDLLAIAGHSWIETSWCSLLAWALSPPRHSECALACQRAVLATCGIELAADAPLQIIAELDTGRGVPDLILLGPELVVVIEAKTGTLEHDAAQTGRMQTDVYLEATREHLQIPSSVRGHTLFLTIAGDAACSPDAQPITWLQVAFALARAIEPRDLPADLRAAYAGLITHWIENAAPERVPVRTAVVEAEQWLAIGARAVRDNLRLLDRLSTALPPTR